MFGIYENTPYFYDVNSTPILTRSADTISYDTANIFGFEWAAPATNSGYTSSINGAQSLTDTVLDMGFGTSTLQLSDDTAEGWDGQMSEVIVYKEVLSQINRDKIESYLAIKYGTTLSQNGSVIASSSHSSGVITATNTGSIGQTFTPTISAPLNALSVMAYSGNTATTATVYLCDATISELASDCIATPGATATLTLPSAPSPATTVTAQFATPIMLTAGTKYVFHIRPTANTLALQDTSINNYSGGDEYSADVINTARDVGFVAYSYATGGRDYVASNGSPVFKASESVDTKANNTGKLNTSPASTASDDYVYTVSAIAKDNSQLLINTKTRSESEVIPFLTTEIENSSLLDDKEFMFIGATNAAVTSIVNTDMPIGLPASTNSRTAREWRVQKKAVVGGAVTVNPAMGTFKLTFDLDAMNLSVTQASGMRLVIDDNGDFTTGTQTIYPASGEPTYDAATNTISFTGVSLADGQYFTLAIPQIAPG